MGCLREKATRIPVRMPLSCLVTLRWAPMAACLERRSSQLPTYAPHAAGVLRGGRRDARRTRRRLPRGRQPHRPSRQLAATLDSSHPLPEAPWLHPVPAGRLGARCCTSLPRPASTPGTPTSSERRSKAPRRWALSLHRYVGALLGRPSTSPGKLAGTVVRAQGQKWIAKSLRQLDPRRWWSVPGYPGANVVAGPPTP